MTRLAAALAIPLIISCTRVAEESRNPDTRQVVRLTVAQRHAVLGEMRTMLQSLHDVLGAATTGDTAALRRAALASGMAAAADPSLEGVLPAEFLALGMRTHAGFDSLAATASAGGMSRDTVVVQLAHLTSACVACHATFQVTTR